MLGYLLKLSFKIKILHPIISNSIFFQNDNIENFNFNQAVVFTRSPYKPVVKMSILKNAKPLKKSCNQVLKVK